MNNLQICLRVKELFYPLSSHLSIRLVYKKICITTNHELEKYENKTSYTLRNSIATINNQIKFKISKEFELRSTKIAIIFIGVKGRNIECLGEANLDIFPIYQQHSVGTHQCQIGLEKTQSPKSHMKFEVHFNEKIVDLSPHNHKHNRPKIPEEGVLKTEGYYKQELYISRRKDAETPTAYEISRRNFKHVEVTRKVATSRDTQTRKKSNGSYKKRFEYESNRLETSRKKSASSKSRKNSFSNNFNSFHENGRASKVPSSNLKVFGKANSRTVGKSPSPKLQNPSPIIIQNFKSRSNEVNQENLHKNFQKLSLDGADHKKISRSGFHESHGNHEGMNHPNLNLNLNLDKHRNDGCDSDQQEQQTFRNINRHVTFPKQKHYRNASLDNTYHDFHHRGNNPDNRENDRSYHVLNQLNQQKDPDEHSSYLNLNGAHDSHDSHSNQHIQSQKQSKYKMITEKLELIENKIKRQKEKYWDERGNKSESSCIGEVDNYEVQNLPHNEGGVIYSSIRTDDVSENSYDTGDNHSHSHSQKAPSPTVRTPELVKNSQQTHVDYTGGGMTMSQFTINSKKNDILRQKEESGSKLEKGFGEQKIQSQKKSQTVGQKFESKDKVIGEPNSNHYKNKNDNENGKNYLETQVKMLELDLQNIQNQNKALNSANLKLRNEMEELQIEKKHHKVICKTLNENINKLKDQLLEIYQTAKPIPSPMNTNLNSERQTNEKQKILEEQMEDFKRKIVKANEQLQKIKKEKASLQSTLQKKDKLIEKLTELNEQNTEKLFDQKENSEKRVCQLDGQLQKLLQRNKQIEQEFHVFKEDLRSRQIMKKSEEIQVEKKIKAKDILNSTSVPQIHIKTVDQPQGNEFLNERKKSMNLQAQLKYAENQIRGLKMQIDNLKLQKQDLAVEIDAIAFNDEKKLAKKGSLQKAQINNHYLSENFKQENKVLKEQIRLLQTQVKDLNSLLDNAIEKTSSFHAESFQNIDKSLMDEQKSILATKYRTLAKRQQIYENELREKKNKMAELINCVWKGGNVDLIDEIDKIMDTEAET